MGLSEAELERLSAAIDKLETTPAEGARLLLLAGIFSKVSHHCAR
jgi:hypothetical protein